MAIETDLTVSPYFESTQENNYYKVLFKPSVPVQVRELNQLQKMLQNQIEEFGDNILKRGTIVRGCSFTFYNNFPYIKIKDNEVGGAEANPSEYVGCYVKSDTNATSSNLVASVVKYEDGFEATDPDLKTLYIRYTTSGSNGSTSAYSTNEKLTVYRPNHTIESFTVTAGGTNYSNNDTISVVSALVVKNTSSVSFGAGDTITQACTTSRAEIVEVNNSIFTDKLVLKIKPVAADLANTSLTEDKWTFVVGSSDVYGITDGTTSATGEVLEVIGSGAAGAVTTDGAGKIIAAAPTSAGSGYYVAPYAAVKPTVGGSSAAVTSLNYVARITVADKANSVGSGYAFGVSEGVVYQKGYFVNVDPQVVVVSKYDQTPNSVAVGFKTNEEIINSSQDPNLLDNALGTLNYTAPGADRLKLSPELAVFTVAEAQSNSEFFSLVEFSGGVPYKQNPRTVYNQIGDEMALRTREESGDYVLDSFLTITKSSTDTSLDANTFTLVVDPGKAYIDGYRVQTVGNFLVDVSKGIDTQTTNNASVSLNYGSYVKIKNLAGDFPFSTGTQIDLYDTVKNYTANVDLVEAGTISSSGTKIGTARIRSLVYDDGQVGTGSDQYLLYLYDVQMNSGKLFRDTKSIYYGSGNKGIADVALTYDASSSSNIAQLNEMIASDGSTMDKMLFYSGFVSPLSVNTFSYKYRTTADVSGGIQSNGKITISLSGSDYWPYSSSATLSNAQKKDLIVVPLDNLRGSSSLTGTVGTSSSSNVITGYNSSAFLTELAAGDYIYMANATVSDLRRITAITNNSSIQVDANCAYSFSNVAFYRYFPKFVPIPVSSRAGMSATVDSLKRDLTINVGTSLNGSGKVANVVVSYNVNTTNLSASSKIPNRSRYVKIRPGNNSTGFSYSGYGTANGTLSTTSGSNAVTGTSTYFSRDFTAGDLVEITRTLAVPSAPGSLTPGSGIATVSDYLTIGTITNNTSMTFTTAVNFTDSSATMRKAGNINGPWCLGVPDVFRLRGVYLANVSTVNTDSYDVTSSFYIDHNQNPNYYGLSYLVKDKNSTLVIQPTDYLLAEFDAFTTSGSVHHINSYVDSNASNRFTTDSLALSGFTDNTALSMNTLEIPQVTTKQGVVYDLLNHLDFRPMAVNTANLSTTSTGANVNPSATVTFDTNDKKFPQPDADAVFTVTEFMGRIDSAVVDKNGKISVLKGQPIVDDVLFNSAKNSKSIPQRGKDTILLNHYRIPSYPNVTEIVSSAVRDIVDTNTINEKLLTTRRYNKTITKLFTTQDTQNMQPRGYTMQDIGKLERRISVLEYYVSLTLLELQIKDKVIPSSLSPNINRFKFGFFADDFSSTKYSDLNSIEYSADVFNGRLIPSSEMVAIPFPNISCNCSPYLIVSQEIATGSSNVTSSVSNVTFDAVQTKGKGSSGAPENKDYYITMASALGNNAGQVSVYCYFYSGVDKLEIYQSNTEGSFTGSPIYTTNNAIALTNTDIVTLRATPQYSGISESDLRKHTLVTVDGDQGWLKNGGKITFNHSPSSGRFYKIVVKEDSRKWNFRVVYPVNAISSLGSGCVIDTPPPTKYIGVLKADKDFSAKVELLAKNVTSNKKNWDHEEYKVIRLTSTGLKPNTKHKFYVNGKDLTLRCDTTPADNMKNVKYDGTEAAWLTSIGAGQSEIMTNERGQLVFDLYLDNEEYKNFLEEGKEKGGKKNTFFFEIYTTDKVSYASTTHKVSSGSNSNARGGGGDGPHGNGPSGGSPSSPSQPSGGSIAHSPTERFGGVF